MYGNNIVGHEFLQDMWGPIAGSVIDNDYFSVNVFRQPDRFDLIEDLFYMSFLIKDRDDYR
jgi:hypothetical protein